MLHGGSGATTTGLVLVTKCEIPLLTWFLGQVINLPKGSPLASQKGDLVGLKVRTLQDWIEF